MSMSVAKKGSDRRSISFADDENIIGGNDFEDEEGDKNESQSLLLKEAGDNSSNSNNKKNDWRLVSQGKRCEANSP